MNLLIGAVSTNYNVSDIERWVKTSEWEDCERILLVYPAVGHDNTFMDFLNENGVSIIEPSFDFWGAEKNLFLNNTGRMDIGSSYELIHNIRFLHIWVLLKQTSYDKVLITDVRDVYFNRNPFDQIPSDGLVATSEEVLYEDHSWNFQHLQNNLGVIGLELLAKSPVYNVGVFGGDHETVKNICSDIYLMSVGKLKVADQTSFNYLINTIYKDVTEFRGLDDKFAVHLHVIGEGHIDFDFDTSSEYSIIHQYDRIPSWSF